MVVGRSSSFSDGEHNRRTLPKEFGVCYSTREEGGVFFLERKRRKNHSSSIEPGALAKKSRPTLDGGRKKGKPVLLAEPCNYNPDGVPIYYSVSQTYIGYYITRTVKRLKGKNGESFFYLIFFVSLRIHNDDINFILTGVVDAACTDEKKKCDRLVYSSRSSTRPSTSSDLLIR